MDRLKQLWQEAKEAIHDLLVEEGYAPTSTSNTKTITSNDIWQFCLNIVVSIFCWPLSLRNPNSAIWVSIGRKLGYGPMNSFRTTTLAIILELVWVIAIIGLFSTLAYPTMILSLHEKETNRNKKNIKPRHSETSLEKEKQSVTKKLINKITGGAIYDYPELLLDPAFMFINLLKTVKALELKTGKKLKNRNNANPARKIVKRSPKVRPLLFYVVAVSRSRIASASENVPILPTSSIAPIERLYSADFVKTNPIQNQNRIEIQSGNHHIIFQTNVEANYQPNKKLMTLGEFEFKRGIDKDGNVPSSKTRNLSKIYELKRNQIGTIRKLRKENHSSETISFDETNSAEVNPTISVLIK